MKKICLFLLFGLLLAAACDKEKEVTVRHPLKAEFEQDAEALFCKVLSIDLSDASVRGTAFGSLVASSGADLLLVSCSNATLDGFKAETWISTHAAEWGHAYVRSGNKAVITGRNAFESTTSLTLSASEAVIASLGGLNYVSASLATTADANNLLGLIRERSSAHWLLSLHGNNLAAAFSGATFTDCVEGALGYGHSFAPAWLLAGPGVWNRMESLAFPTLDGLSSSAISFTINSYKR